MLRFHQPVELPPEVERTGELQLGNISMPVALCKLPDKSGYFLYFKLNDHSELIEEGARLVAERIQSLGIKNPYFVTPEASTLALAHVLRHKYNINGTTVYKTKQLNDISPVSVNYDSVTSTNKKMLFLGKNRAAAMHGKDIILLDSVCTTGGTLSAMYNLLIKAGIVPQQIVEATMLFTEGKDRTEIDVATNVTLKLHRFSTLPLYHVPCNDLKIGLVGSESEIKLSAIKNSLSIIVPGNKWDIVGVPAQSGKPEQPVEEETLEGAINRANDALRLSPDSDLVIAIESGIFKIPDDSPEGFSWHDKAIIYCLTRDGQSHIYYSETVKFPTDCVEEARRRGFDKCTVAMVMLEKGLIKNHKDPHADISPFKPRAEYLQEAASLLCKDLFNQQAPSPSVRLTPNL
jgi:adenine phosphoribosyltransferase